MKPPIWRRVQVPEYYNFHNLHVVIQYAMGWKSAEHDYHLHQFYLKKPNGVEISVGSIGSDIKEKETEISQYFSLSNTKGKYEYDLGMSWEHEILLEKILPGVVGVTYPKCIAGKRACPHEDGVEEEENEPRASLDKFDPRYIFLMYFS